MKKKINPILFISILLFVVSALSYFVFNIYELHVKKAPSKSAEILFPEELKEPEIVKQICERQDLIDYFYYQEVPEEKKSNNKFGIYIYAEVSEFFRLAERLVNSSGGEWGYVLIPYNIRDRDKSKWNEVFSQLNRRKLIPVVQLYDVNPNNYEEDTKEAAEFLDQFLWPIKQRYISVYNEPNDSRFWKGILDPKNYAEVLNFTIDTFKLQNDNFFMLNGAFNVSASNVGTTMDSFQFILAMNDHIPGIFSKLDGWASHPYPQPNFSGSPYASGRNSIRAYEDELAFLESLGVSKKLPVFITETGWAHAEGEVYNPSFLPASEVAQNFKIAYEEFWLADDRVVAIMPFTIWYGAPFDHFAWVNSSRIPYEQFDVVKSIEKVKGNPDKLVKAGISIGCEVNE
mgnify:CR=1 FL=1